MKTRSFFIIALLCLFFSAYSGQAQVLDKKISLQVKDATLPQVLQKIQRQYAIRFSYLNNSLPTKQRFSAEISDKPLAEVLDVLLSKTDIGYLEKNGQIIIKKGLPKKQPKPTTFKKLPPSTPETKSNTKIVSSTKPSNTKTESSARKDTETKTRPAARKNADQETTAQEQITTANAPVTTTEPIAAETSTSAGVPDSAKTKKIEITFKNIFSKSNNSDTTEIRPFHFGLIYPLSTNGFQANRYVNRVSLQLLAGTAAGLSGFELAGIGNVEKKYVKGFQVGGIYNIVQNQSDNAINQDYTLQGWQVAGLLNVSAGNSAGAQVGGLLNITQNMKGAQIAGFLNKADNVKGAQIAGFLNRAKYVNGAQIGFINVADSMAGVPIGLISIVKKGGYRRLELYHADDFEANVTYKIGVPHFYNIIALGVQLDDKKRWGYGAGFGAEWTVVKWLHVNTDIMSYNVIEESYENFPNGFLEADELNLLNKFRLLATLQLSKRLALFGGPVYNVFVSQYLDPDSDQIGSGLVIRSFYNRTAADGTNVKMWIGFNAGLRF